MSVLMSFLAKTYRLSKVAILSLVLALSITAVAIALIYSGTFIHVTGKVKAPEVNVIPVVVDFGNVPSGDYVTAENTSVFEIKNVGIGGVQVKFTSDSAPQGIVYLALNITIINVDTKQIVWSGAVYVDASGLRVVEPANGFEYPFILTSGKYEVHVKAEGWTAYVERDTDIIFELDIVVETPENYPPTLS